jgi:hypothetical protein
MTIWRTRIDLARDGWQTTLRIEAPRGALKGELGFWARSHHWAGRLSDVCFHAHASIPPGATPLDVVRAGAGIVDTVARTCLTARAEWPDRVPCAMPGAPRPDGRLVLAEHGTETAYIQARPANVFPTEAIDPGTSFWEGDHPDALLHAMHGAWVEGCTNENVVRVAHAPGRWHHDVTDRIWTFEASVVVHTSAGTGVAYKPVKARTDVLEDPAAADLLASLHRSTQGLFQAYAPNGSADGRTPNGLPPGFVTQAAQKALMDARIAAMEANGGDQE